ncbi:MAG: DUF1028 domain-containing protein [Pseudomonadota bacterium]
MTFSISARCPSTGMFGIAVTSSSMAVAARCAFVRAGVGAVATQNITDPRLGPRGLDLMAAGADAEAALATMLAEHDYPDYRQLVLIDKQGGTAHHSGTKTLGRHKVAAGSGVVAAGNLLADEGVPQTMIAAFDAAREQELPARLLAAMAAGLAAGGEEGEIHSAGMVVADDAAWPMVDLRVDWTDADPIAELAGHWARWAPQMRDYVTRGLDPTQAPAYGVPGDP